MASSPKTVGYHLATATGKLKGKNSLSSIKNSKQFKNWVSSRPTKPMSQVMQEKMDATRKARPLATLETNNVFSRHNADMSILSNRPTNSQKSNYSAWKARHLAYNSALSRQQLLQPGNRAIQAIEPTNQSPTKKYPAPITKYYVPRGGQLGTTFQNDLPDTSKPFIQAV